MDINVNGKYLKQYLINYAKRFVLNYENSGNISYTFKNYESEKCNNTFKSMTELSK